MDSSKQKLAGHWEDGQYYMKIVRDKIPSDINIILNEIREYSDPSDVDDPNSGLAFQWKCNLIQKDDLIEILNDRKKIRKMIENGVFQP